MIKLFGPKVPRYTFTDSGAGKMVASELDGFQIEASSLGEALGVYADKFGFKVSLYDNQAPEVQLDKDTEAKYYWLEGLGESQGPSIVDIHIVRSGTEICAKQALEFPLMDGDIILIGPLAC